MTDDATLPPGFQIDSPPTPSQAAPEGSSELPPGFELDSDHYSSPGEMAKTALEGAGRGLLGAAAPVIESRVFGIPESKQLAREKTNPSLGALGEASGLGIGMLTGTGEAALMSKAGQLAVDASGLMKAKRVGDIAGEGFTMLGKEIAPTLAHKVGSEAVRQAVEMAVLGANDEVSKMVLNDPDTSTETAIANVGLAAALGAGGGALAASVSPLWKATLGPKVEGVFGALKSRLNGTTESSIMKEAQDLGIAKDLPPDVAGAMSDNPMVRNAASGLRQTDTSHIARNFQERENQFRESVASRMSEVMGKTPAEAAALDISEASHGKAVGDALHQEFKARLDPITDDLNSLKSKFAGTELPQGGVMRTVDNSNPYEPKVTEHVIPSLQRTLADKMTQLAGENGWLADPLSQEARLIKTTIKDLKNKKTLDDLVRMGQNIGKNTRSTLPFGIQTPLSRAGTMVRGVLRDAENEVMLAKLGKESPELVGKFRNALQEFKEVAQLKDEINSRLKIGGDSVNGFVKGLGEMARTDSETLLARLKGTKDAHLLAYLDEHFPATAERLRDYHLSAVLEKAIKDGRVSPKTLLTKVEGLSPELRQFAVGEERESQLKRLNAFLERLNDHRHNFSNTARTVDKVMGDTVATAMGLAAVLGGHGGLGIVAPVAAILGREGVAATRLAMLKFLGSDVPVSGPGVKAMASLFNASIKGNNNINKAVASVFKPGIMNLAEVKATPKDLARLDKLIVARQDDPNKPIEDANNSHVGHYLDRHQVALTETTTRGADYLKSLKPQPYRASPLDREIPPTPAQEARYDRALGIAHDPRVVIARVKDGTLQQSDIQDLVSLYPALYTQFSQKLSNAMINHKGNDEPIPYKTRVGLSLFLGQPLDTSMQPASIMAAQPQPPAPHSMPPKSSAKLGKAATNAQTPNQAAEAHKADRK